MPSNIHVSRTATILPLLFTLLFSIYFSSDFACLSLLWHIEFTAADAFKRTLGECRGVMYKDTLIYILSICVNMTLVCFLMQCRSIYIKVVPGGAGHV